MVSKGKFPLRYLLSATASAGALLCAAAPGASAQEATPSPAGFFEDGLEVGSTRKGAGGALGENLPVGPLFGDRDTSVKKGSQPPALVPDIERSNEYSVPVRTPRPSPTPEITAPPQDQAPVHTESLQERSVVPKGPGYYQDLINRATQPNETPTPGTNAPPAGLKPAKRQQTYTF